MTTTPDAPPTTPDVVTINADADEELAQLYASYPEAKARADEAKKVLEAITTSIKLKLNEMAPEERKLELVGPNGQPLRMTYSERRRSLDTNRIKAELPHVYRDYLKPPTGSWSLAVAKGGA